MNNHKITKIILIFTVCILFANCQPTVRFTNNKQNNNNNNSLAENRNAQKQNNQNITTENKNSQTKNVPQTNIPYNKPAKIIYPTSKIGKHSNKIISVAESWLGVPYLYGGTTRKGVDCSGFVRNVYSELGVNLPRTSREQFAFAIPVTKPTVGDLVFFSRNGRIHHVGIYTGNDNIIHSAINKGVRFESIKGNSLERTFTGFGRVNFG